MARLAVCVLALMVAGALSAPEPVPSPVEPHPQPVVVPRDVLEFQKKVLFLFFHPHEPLHWPEHLDIVHSWDLKSHVEEFSNKTAVWEAVQLMEQDWVLPHHVPFSIMEPEHKFQAVTFFNLLYSAKTLDTFYKTAVYLRHHINEYLFVYVTSIALYHRPDTQGFPVPPLYEIFPSFFANGEILTTAQRISTHGKHMVEYYPSTFVWDNNVVIRWNSTVWPYFSEETPVAYYSNDYGLNNFYYNWHLMYPSWLGGETVPLVKDRRGEVFWFLHKQILARYYLERLSNGLGEIPELGLDVVEQGYTPGLIYHSGIPYPVRPHFFQLQQPWFVEQIYKIIDYEHRVRDAVDMGIIVTPSGEHIDIRAPEAIDVLGRLVQADADSPNPRYYKDFIGIWKAVLGNSNVFTHYHWKGVPWVMPSTLEQYQTTMRDPAFYMIWKRVMKIFNLWHEQLPPYKNEEIALPGVEIEKVEVDKLVTYFEHTYMNVSNHLHLNEYESSHMMNGKSVVVQIPRLNHKVFSVRVHVKSDVPKNVVVRLFLAPKYDSHGKEIPLHLNCHNFYQFDQFTYALKQGDNVMTHTSSENQFVTGDFTSSFSMYEKIMKSLEGHEQFFYTPDRINNFLQRLLLPKGRVGGMPFVVMVHIAEHHAPNVIHGTGFNPSMSLGLGSGALRWTSDPLGYPVDRPLHQWQVEPLKNFWFEDVMIYHKHTPEVYVPHLE